MGIDFIAKLSATSSSILQSENKDGLLAAVDSACAELDIDHFALTLNKTDKRDLLLNAAICNLPGSFLKDYDQRNRFDNDPIAAKAMVAKQPFQWSVEDKYTESGYKDYMEYLRSVPIYCGFMIPLAGLPGTVSCFSVIRTNNKPFNIRARHAAVILANFARLKAELLGLSNSVSSDEAKADPTLTPLQTKIMRWVVDGKSNADISQILELSERSVRYQMSEILRKLGVASRTQAAIRFRTWKSAP